MVINESHKINPITIPHHTAKELSSLEIAADEIQREHVRIWQEKQRKFAMLNISKHLLQLGKFPKQIIIDEVKQDTLPHLMQCIKYIEELIKQEFYTQENK